MEVEVEFVKKEAVTYREIFKSTVPIVLWKRGDPFPFFGKEVAIDTETELITDCEYTPPLVVTGVYNRKDNTCYIVSWEDSIEFVKEIARRDIKIYFANAGFDYYELWSEELQEAASPERNNVVDILIRAAIRQVGTVGFIMSRSLKDCCKYFLGYEMDKHEDEGDASIRVNFRRDTPVTEDQYKYLALDCICTYFAAQEMKQQPTEEAMTRGAIVLYRIQKNGFPLDMEVFNYCEKLLDDKMEEYRQQLINFGFPDPLKKKEAKEIDVLEEQWDAYVKKWMSTYIDEEYKIPKGLPDKTTCRRMFMYLFRGIHKKEDKANTVRYIAAILLQKKKALSKVEASFFDSICESADFITACDALKKREVWPIIIKNMMDCFLEDKDIEQTLSFLDDMIQEHTDWFAKENPIKPKEFLQQKLQELQKLYKGLEFDKTEKTGELKCSKTDSWMLEDVNCKDPFLQSYNNFVHVQKYKSTFVNRSHVKSDGKVHARFGIVNTLRSSCSNPNIQQYPSRDKEFPLKNMFRPPTGTILVATDFSFAELVSLAQCCYTKYGESVLRDIINADVCPHYFFAGVMLGLISPDISFCKDPDEVKKVKAYLKEHVATEERQKAKGVKKLTLHTVRYVE